MSALKAAFICLLSALVTFGADAANEEQPQLTLYTEVFPPYNFLEENKLVGINADIVRLVCEGAGIDCKFEVYPWNRAMSLTLADPQSGIFSTSRNTAREKLFQWVGPLESSTSCFFKLSNRDDIQITRREDLLQHTLGVSHKDVYQMVLEKWGFELGRNFILYGGKFDDGNSFSRGKLDLFISSIRTLPTYLERSGLTYADIEPVWVLYDESLVGNFIGLNKSVDPKLVSHMQQALEDVRKQGKVTDIIKKYQPPRKDRKAVADRLQVCW